MAEASRESILLELLKLHATDQQIVDLEHEVRERRRELEVFEEGVTGLSSRLEQLDTNLERALLEARRAERALDERRDALDRTRSRVSQVQNQRQYSAASLEFDLIRQDVRKLEDMVLDKLQVVENLEGARKGLAEELESSRGEMGPRREAIAARLEELQDELTIKGDRRDNLAMRIDARALGLYDRIRGGRSRVAMAPLSEEAACGNCHTSVTIQQEMQIKSLSTLICCEGCGVILYPRDLKVP